MISFVVDKLADKALALTDDPNKGIMMVVKEENSEMTPELVKRIAEAVNVKSFLKHKNKGMNLEEAFPVADGEKVIIKLLKDSIISNQPKKTKEACEGIPDYYAGYYDRRHENLDLIRGAKCLYNPSGAVWVQKKARRSSFTKVSSGKPINKKGEAFSNAARGAREYLCKFAGVYSKDLEFVAQMRYLMPNSRILKTANMCSGERKIPRAVLRNHTNFMAADKIIGALQKKKDELSRLKKEGAGHRFYPTSVRDTPAEKKETEKQYAVYKKLIGPKSFVSIGGDRVAHELEKSLRGRSAREINKAVKEYGELQNKSYLKKTLKNTPLSPYLNNLLGIAEPERAEKFKPKEPSQAYTKFQEGLSNSLLGNYAKALKESVRVGMEERKPLFYALRRISQPRYEEGLEAKREARTDAVVTQLKLRANFENALKNDPVLADASPEELLPVYNDAVELATTAMEMPSIVKAVLRSAHAHGTGALDPATAQALVTLEAKHQMRVSREYDNIRI